MPRSDLSDLSIEPANLRELTLEQKDRLTEVLDRYLSALESGVPLQREKLFQEHPDLAETLQAYLASLDALHDVAAGFGDRTDRPARQPAPPDGDEKRLGDFVLGREIGRGGMGVVYEARQISLGRRVALKVLPFAAVLDAKQLVRFKNEAQAAAQLHHPHIVPVFAIGSERGVHYYAMQLIDGQPLDRAIAELRKRFHLPVDASADGVSVAPTAPAIFADVDQAAPLPSTQGSILTKKSANRQEYYRTVIRLGVQAAEALQAAHDEGVIHRDIKPSNLLLDGAGKLWVTDFGLARCQTDVSLTRTGDLVGTMRYMSPEQAAGQSALVDQRTDVYSLGATLYELLALRPAFAAPNGPALQRQIEQEEPVRLRTLQPQIPADLETVVGKAMAKHRDERYRSAREFAEDLQRVLDGKPTLAKPPTIPDRLHKWARRHRRVVATIAAGGLLAVLGLAVSTFFIAREKSRAEQNYARAEANFRQARRAVDHFGAQLAERLADIPGAEQVRRELLQETLGYYHEFVTLADQDPALQADLAMTYTKIGTIAGEIGAPADAVSAYRDAERILGTLAGAPAADAEHRRHLALCRNNLALLLRRQGSVSEARRMYEEAIRLQKLLVAEFPAAAQYRADLALSHNNLGLLQSDTGEPRRAEASVREALRLQEELVRAAPDDPEHLRSLAASYNNLAALASAEHATRAAECYDQALTYQQRAVAARPADLECQSDVALTYNNLGAAHARARRFPAAAAAYGRAIAIQGELVRTVPARTSYRRDLAVSYNNLGLMQSEWQQTADAEQSFRHALELQTALVEQHPGDVGLESSLGGIYNNLGIVLEAAPRLAEAAEAYRHAVAHQQVAFARATSVARYRVFLSKHYYNYGRVLRQLGAGDQAARVALTRRELWPHDPQRLLTVAEELGLASQCLGATTGTGMTADQCATAALETLRQAVAAGLQVPAGLGQTEAFAALKDRPEFTDLEGR